MKALTIKQPWLHAITAGAKRVENRSWAPPERIIGAVIALHAGKAYDYGAVFPAGAATPGWEPGALAEGCITAVATVTEYHHPGRVCNQVNQAACSPWAVRGHYHWVLDRVRPLAEPVPCRGMQRLWELPADAEKAVRAQMEEPG